MGSSRVLPYRAVEANVSFSKTNIIATPHTKFSYGSDPNVDNTRNIVGSGLYTSSMRKKMTSSTATAAALELFKTSASDDPNNSPYCLVRTIFIQEFNIRTQKVMGFRDMCRSLITLLILRSLITSEDSQL